MQAVSRSCPSDVPLHPLIAERWSPRALQPDRDVTDGQLVAVLEAARWAPSSGNRQPWRFLVGRRGDETFTGIYTTLFDGNQLWAGNASALLLACAITHAPDGTAMPTAPYELGMATAQLCLQAQDEGLVAHQMGGFDAEKAALVFTIPDHVRPYAVIALGYLADPSTLPAHLRTREQARRERRRVRELAFSKRYGEAMYLR
ncbi:MAG: nitroreductase family protein [Actinobacteria bacterium]|nr:nitroreductase family protein [Actinomycetota bacterium]MBI3687295.1 nitroreductase family protein [Actinomycetota bacterium]